MKVIIKSSYEWQGEAKGLGISHRELEVFAILAEGHRYKEIAEILDIKHQSVKNYMHSLYKKLGVNNGASAMLIALSMNLVEFQYADIPGIESKLTSTKVMET